MADMYEEFKDTFNSENYSYVLKKKFDSGTTVEIEFYLGEMDQDGPLYVEIALRSYTKRKHKKSPDFEFTVRGKDGLQPAVWATENLLSFPEYIFSDSYWSHKDRIVYEIFWSDSRRRTIYHKWLSRYGFYFGSSLGSKCLTKIYDRV